MIKDLLSALFLARKLFNASVPNSAEEHTCWVLMNTVESAVYNKVGYEKGRVYVIHIEHLADGVQWEYFRELSALNSIINYKAKMF